MIGVGFEPTPPRRLVPKTSALDRSAIQPLGSATAACPPPVVKNKKMGEKSKKYAPTVGLEPTTTRLRVLRSTN